MNETEDLKVSELSRLHNVTKSCDYNKINNRRIKLRGRFKLSKVKRELRESFGQFFQCQFKGKLHNA